MRVKGTWLALLLVLWSLLLAGCTGGTQPAVDLGQVEIGQFRTEQPWVELNGNQPDFAQEESPPKPLRPMLRWMPWGAAGRPMPTSAPRSCPPSPGERSAR